MPRALQFLICANIALIAVPAALALSGCMTAGAGGPADMPAIAGGQLANAAGDSKGSVMITAVDTATIRLSIDARGLNAGRFGTHVHAVGRCDPPDFMSAGPHWNPAGRQHGRNNPMGSHDGDLPNIDIAADGSGRLVIDMDAARLDGLFDADGAAVIIHAGPDDDVTDPTGNSGARVACAVLRRVTLTPQPG